MAAFSLKTFRLLKKGLNEKFMEKILFFFLKNLYLCFITSSSKHITVFYSSHVGGSSHEKNDRKVHFHEGSKQKAASAIALYIVLEMGQILLPIPFFREIIFHENFRKIIFTKKKYVPPFFTRI